MHTWTVLYLPCPDRYNMYIDSISHVLVQGCWLRRMWTWSSWRLGPTPSTQAHIREQTLGRVHSVHSTSVQCEGKEYKWGNQSNSFHPGTHGGTGWGSWSTVQVYSVRAKNTFVEIGLTPYTQVLTGKLGKRKRQMSSFLNSSFEWWGLQYTGPTITGA